MRNKTKPAEGARSRPARETKPVTTQAPAPALTTELLILPDGRILVHNLTQPFAELLHELNPNAEQITSRITHHASINHELPN
jgi:hypothetical protein